MSEQEQPEQEQEEPASEQHGPVEEDRPYVDPNSGAAPQPGGGVSGGLEQARQLSASQDEATQVSEEQAQAAMEGNGSDLESMTKAELTEMAEREGVEVKSSMTKQELIQALEQKRSRQ
jgi:Rho termination factor, N-terminal domain